MYYMETVMRQTYQLQILVAESPLTGPAVLLPRPTLMALNFEAVVVGSSVLMRWDWYCLGIGEYEAENWVWR